MRNLFILLLLAFSSLACKESQGNETLEASPTSLPEEPVVINSPAEQNEIQWDSLDIRTTDGIAQLNWDLLGHVEFEERYTQEINRLVPYPLFHPQIRALQGEKVRITGYVIPLEETGDETILVLSAYPYTQCFFCGNAGPESVMDIVLKRRNKDLSMDEKVTFQGKLKLNDTDLYYLNYILEDAEIVR